MSKQPGQKPSIKAGPQATKERSGFSTIQKLAILLAVIAVLVYANTLQHDYALDDFIVIKKNSIVTRGISAIPELLTTPYHYGYSIEPNDLYRPLTMVLFAIEYQLSGGSPSFGHFMNILLFAGCVMLLFLFLDTLFEKKKTVLAFIAALLFALHPIHTEVVANIKSSDELLCFLFCFAALFRFADYVKSGAALQLAIGAALYFLALLSKETAITFLAVIPLIFFFFLNTDRKRSLSITASTALVAAAYLVIRHLVLSANHANVTSDVSFIDNMLSGAPSFGRRIATAISILGNYIKLLFVPYPLICDYSFSSIPFVSFGNVVCRLSLASYTFLSVFGMFRLLKTPKDPLAFGILFFLATIALFSNIPFLIGAAMAERFTFFASAGFCIAIAFCIDKWVLRDAAADVAILKTGKTLAILVPICLLYSIMTIARNSDWKNNMSLFKTDAAKSPNNSRLHYYVGTDHLIAAEADPTDPAAKQLVEDGITELKRSLAIYPGFVLVNSELGNAYFTQKNYDSSMKYYELALVQKPDDTLVLHNLAGVYYFQKKFDQSIALGQKAVAIDPNFVRGYRNMGLCYVKTGKFDSAIIAMKKAIAIEPKVGTCYQIIAYSFQMTGKEDSARKYEAIARQMNPNFKLDATPAK